MNKETHIIHDTELVHIDEITAERIGDVTESLLAGFFDLERNDNCHYDLSSDEYPYVQAKSTGWRVRNGYQNEKQAYTIGRFRLYESDHEWLCENDGHYAFLVYERHPDGIIPLWSKLTTANIVEQQYLSENPWYAGSTPRKATGNDYRVKWTTLFGDIGVEP